jgi:hypothetical protein
MVSGVRAASGEIDGKVVQSRQIEGRKSWFKGLGLEAWLYLARLER